MQLRWRSGFHALHSNNDSPIIKKRRSTSPQKYLRRSDGEQMHRCSNRRGYRTYGYQKSTCKRHCILWYAFEVQRGRWGDYWSGCNSLREARIFLLDHLCLYLAFAWVGCLALGQLHADIRQSLSNDGHGTLQTITTSTCLTFSKHSLCRLFCLVVCLLWFSFNSRMFALFLVIWNLRRRGL